MIPAGKLNCLNVGIMRLKLGEAPSPLNLVTSCPCEFWFDGQDTATLSLNGNRVIQWDDKSGNARHVANAVDAQRPTYDPVTGRLTFVAANQTYLQSAAFGAALVQPNTIFVVYKITGVLADVEYVFTGVAIPGRNRFSYGGANFTAFAGANINAGIIDANDNIHSVEFNGLISNYWINGILRGGPANIGVNTLDGITLGTSFNLGGNFADVEVMEVFGYNCLLTLAERIALNAYLTSKWGL